MGRIVVLLLDIYPAFIVALVCWTFFWRLYYKFTFCSSKRQLPIQIPYITNYNRYYSLCKNLIMF
jgi:hypothetical protein